MGSADCGLRIAEWGVGSAECGLRNGEWGMGSADCGMANGKMRIVDCRLRVADFGKPQVEGI